MHCDVARLHLLDLQRARLTPALGAEVRVHLQGCAACALAWAGEEALTCALERSLPQYAAPLALKRRLRAGCPASVVLRSPRGRWRALVPALTMTTAIVIGVPVVWDRVAGRLERAASESMVREAVNDHVRLLASTQPLEVRSGGIHQVKPWFAGRVDFAPVVPFGGDDVFPLRGGAVGYFLDRRAAVFVFGHRLHVVSLFVFRGDGLPWPRQGLTAIGPVQVHAERTRGFSTLLWRRADLGYALVSDVDDEALRALTERLVRAD